MQRQGHESRAEEQPQAATPLAAAAMEVYGEPVGFTKKGGKG